MNFDRMRALILEQAVQGKLVPQLESEPNVCQIGDDPDNAPFTIPEKWKWAKLGTIGRWKAGGTPLRSHPEYFQNGHIPWLKTGDLTDGVIESVEEYITEEAIANSSTHINPIGSVLIAMYGATIGKLGILRFPCATNQACCACDVNMQICDRWYLFYFLLSQRDAFIAQGAGGAQPNISRTKIVNYWIPLPPPDEQIRIVVKIKQLFEQIDRAEKAYNELSGPLSERFRQLCLEQAIQGKLVPQLESEPKVKQIGEVPEDVPFDIPEKWAWIQLGELINYGSSKQIEGSQITPSTWVLDLEDIEKNSGKLLKKKYGTKTTSNKSCFKKGDVLYGKLRPYLNKVLIADEDGCCSTEIVPISVSSAKLKLDAEFLSYFLRSPYFVGYANSCAYGVKMPRLGTKDAKSAWVAIPPLKEQRRIVTHINELLSKVECLKAN